MNKPIEAGTLVRVTTVNGGDITARLASRYVPTYSVDLERFAVGPERLKSIEIVERFDPLVWGCELPGEAPQSYADLLKL